MRHMRISLGLVFVVLSAGLGCGVMSAPPPPRPVQCDLSRERIVFVSAEIVQGSSLNGADGICARFAESSSTYGSIYANKKWMAWLSYPDSAGRPGSSAFDRIKSRVTDETKPWSLRYGENCYAIFNNLASLSGSPQLPINRDQHASMVASDQAVWTGTDANGHTAAGTPTPQCVGKDKVPWSDPSGVGSYGTLDSPVNWSTARGNVEQIKTRPCTDSARLYCFEVDKD